MGLDWLVGNRVSDGASPAEVIGCKRFKRSCPESIAWLEAQKEHFGLQGAPTADQRVMLSIDSVLTHSNLSEALEKLEFLAAKVGVSFASGQFAGSFDEQMRDRACEWLTAAFLFGFKADNRWSSYHQAVAAMSFQQRIWMHDWQSKYIFETARDKVPGASGSFVAPPTSFRGKCVQYAGIPDDLADMLFQELDVKQMVDLADQLETFADLKTAIADKLRSATPLEEGEQSHLSDMYLTHSDFTELPEPERADSIMEDAEDLRAGSAWLKFWAERDVPMIPWY